jgi:hypothetical protein
LRRGSAISTPCGERSIRVGDEQARTTAGAKGSDDLATGASLSQKQLLMSRFLH